MKPRTKRDFIKGFSVEANNYINELKDIIQDQHSSLLIKERRIQGLVKELKEFNQNKKDRR